MGWDEEGHALDFLCECPDPNCVETRAEYAERREQGYIVAESHVGPARTKRRLPALPP